jgi:hypothetical protein
MMVPSKNAQIVEAAARDAKYRKAGISGDASREEIAAQFRAQRRADAADADDIQQVWTHSGWQLKQKERN